MSLHSTPSRSSLPSKTVPTQGHAGMTINTDFAFLVPSSFPLSSSPSSNAADNTPNATPSSSSSSLSSTHHAQQQEQEPSSSSASAIAASASAPRKRTRTTPEQLAVLEKTFSVNPSPNNRVREQLSRELGMSERSIQIWFQNRRAKVKNIAKRSTLLQDEAIRLQYYAARAASAACQAAAHQRQQLSPDGTPIADPDLYYYYYYYYYNQQRQTTSGLMYPEAAPHYASITMMPPPPQLPLHGMPPPPPPPLPQQQAKDMMQVCSMTPPPSSPTMLAARRLQQAPSTTATGRLRAHSMGMYYSPYSRNHIRHASMQDLGTATNVSPTSSTLRSRHFGSASPAPQLNWPANSFMSQEISPIGHGTSAFWPPPPPPPPGVDFSMSRMGTPMSMDDVNISPIENTSSQSTLSHQHRFSAEALQIGTWKRISLQSQDLVCQYDTQQHHMVWCIQDGTQRFKMEFSVERIQRIRLEPLLERLGWARLEIHLDQPQLAFYMEDVSQQCWTQCRDFTQDRQATTTLIHQLDGPALALRAELTRIAQDDAYVQQALAQSDQPSLLSNTPSLLDPTQIPNSNSSMIFPNVHPMSSAPTTMMMAMNHDTHSHPHGFDKKQQDQDEFLLFQTLDPPS